MTVWETRQEMLDFMRSGAHEDIMWDFSKWLDSFWLMRWRPSEQEIGEWDGLELARRRALPAPPLEKSPEQEAQLTAAFDSMPRLRAASSPSGAASIDYAPGQRRARAQVAGGVGGTLRIEVPRRGEAFTAWLHLRRIRSHILANEDVLRSAFGISRANETYMLAIFRNAEAWSAFETSDAVQGLRDRWPEGVWTMRWDAENEFGQWDGMRMRRIRLGSMIAMPDAAKKAAMGSDKDA
ncbi:MAG: hypothetical protein ACR2L3_05090 [Actinomycetota bacterium]